MDTEKRTEEILAMYMASDERAHGRPPGPEDITWLRRFAGQEALREARALRHWDHMDIREAPDHNGQAAVELLFYTTDNGMGSVSVMPLTLTEMAEAVDKMTSYLNGVAIAAAEDEAAHAGALPDRPVFTVTEPTSADDEAAGPLSDNPARFFDVTPADWADDGA